MMASKEQKRREPANWYFMHTQDFTSKWKRALAQFTICFIQLGLRFFAISPFKSSSIINGIYTACWIAEIIVVTCIAYYNNDTGGYTIGGLVSSLLFLSEMLAHLTVVIESLMTRTERERVLALYGRIDAVLSEKLKFKIKNQEATWNWVVKLLPLIILQLTLLLIVTWTHFQANSPKSVTLYWYSYLSALAIKFRLLQLLLAIMRINGYIKLLQCNIDAIGVRNLQRLFGLTPAMRLWQKSLKLTKINAICKSASDADEERQLVTLKNLHNEIFLLFSGLNNCFGWSLLIVTASYFIDLLCNVYLLFVAILTQGRDIYSFIRNGGFVLTVVIMLTTLCWHCQKSFDSSRYIGCLIYKLVKPLGNKRYNDLVSEFSLQTLHQQYIITAKQFFQLNLNLLGSMVAAIVTYLVILIQFMLTEKSSTTTANSSTTTVIIMTNTPTTALAVTSLPSVVG